MFDDWLNKFNVLNKRIGSELITGKEFSELIIELCSFDGSPYSAIQFEVSNLKTSQIVMQYGSKKYSSADISEKITLNTFWNCTLKAWRNVQIGDTEVKIKDLFLSFWKEENRDEKAHIISMQLPKAASLCQKLLAAKSEAAYTVFAFGDLDKFKQVNDFMGMDEGDRVIAEFGTILVETLGDEGVVIHNSGDEFVIVFRCSLVEEALLSLFRVSDLIKKHDFNLIAKKAGRDERNDEQIEQGQRIDIDITFGVTYFANEGNVFSWEELFKKAENTMSKKQANGLRGTTRISHFQDRIDQPVLRDFDYKAAYVLAKANIDTTGPFCNVWLNALSIVISSISETKNISEEVCNFTSWMKNDTVEGVSFCGEDVQILVPAFSNMEIIMAISHGLARRKDCSPIIWKMQNEKFSVIYGSDCVISYDEIHDISELPFMTAENSTEIQDLRSSEYWAKRAILIKIGHANPVTPASLFAKCIIVDDRPTKGGALPDFWERVFAQIIFLVTNNKNLSHLIICGDKENGGKTIQLLSEVSTWDPEYIQWLSEKTKSQIGQIQEVKKRIGNNVIIENDIQKLIEKLFELYSCEARYVPVDIMQEDFHSRILVRNAILEKENRLQNSDGIRISTISEAYPMMLDIVRSMISDSAMLCLFDQAGQEFLELTDFKVHLTNPTIDMVPFFFSKRDKEYLDNYYVAAFETDGLFFKEFTLNGTNQYEQVIKHLVETVSNIEKKFSTRRAILVLPHNPVENTPLSPLGLVSVRIMPTYEGRTIKINYSLTWRTVEAVIGFPYSIYGSVKFSQFITSDIKGRIEKINPSIDIKIGTVSYIAHSLHMFTDTYTQEIIRGIINDASK